MNTYTLLTYVLANAKVSFYDTRGKRKDNNIIWQVEVPQGGLPKDRTAADWKSHGSDDEYGSCNVCQLGRSPRKNVILDHDHCHFVGASKKLEFDSATGQNSSASTANSDKAKNIEAEAVTDTSTSCFEPPPVTSVPTERFKNRAVAKIFSCAICLGVPTEQPVLSSCQHMYCESCMGHWLEFSNV